MPANSRWDLIRGLKSQRTIIYLFVHATAKIQSIYFLLDPVYLGLSVTCDSQNKGRLFPCWLGDGMRFL
jgi:hypothetical protein